MAPRNSASNSQPANNDQPRAPSNGPGTSIEFMTGHQACEHYSGRITLPNHENGTLVQQLFYARIPGVPLFTNYADPGGLTQALREWSVNVENWGRGLRAWCSQVNQIMQVNSRCSFHVNDTSVGVEFIIPDTYISQNIFGFAYQRGLNVSQEAHHRFQESYIIQGLANERVPGNPPGYSHPSTIRSGATDTMARYATPSPVFQQQVLGGMMNGPVMNDPATNGLMMSGPAMGGPVSQDNMNPTMRPPSTGLQMHSSNVLPTTYSSQSGGDSTRSPTPAGRGNFKGTSRGVSVFLILLNSHSLTQYSRELHWEIVDETQMKSYQVIFGTASTW